MGQGGLQAVTTEVKAEEGTLQKPGGLELNSIQTQSFRTENKHL